MALADTPDDFAPFLSIDRALELSVEAAKACRDAAGQEPLRSALLAAVAILRSLEGRIIVTGVGKSGHIGKKLAATFASTGSQAYFVHPTEASHGDLGMVGRGDAILALSWSGETKELADIVTYAQRFAVPLIAVTSRADSTLAACATAPLILPRVTEACPHGLAPTTSSQIQLAIGDALAVALLEAKGFSAADFKALHPGGKLGAQLRSVRDVMHRGDRLPLVTSGTSFRAAVDEITRKGFGITGVVDEDGDLIGVLTDGDIRRSIGKVAEADSVDAVMTKGPTCIEPGATAAAALEIMEGRITALFVLEEGRPIGLLHMHDLLRAGVA